MSDVTCSGCGTTISLNPRKPLTTCPSCQALLPVTTFQPAAPPLKRARTPEPQPARQEPFRLLRTVAAFESLSGFAIGVLGLVLFVVGVGTGSESQIVFGIAGLAVGTNSVVIGQLIAVFLSIERHLRAMAEKP